ncbi:hypothetical protein SCHPADRAFT_946963 [Schizopora paradoxa]|uniref:Uncharacterized protein n=1 Tax=Schizopora paradoxa TaxID=27342 RepID=A0A0H2R224_9AGAM|nr:hypothetical protein SCHPADRAFT_946963 [Schizopora paradoxa]
MPPTKGPAKEIDGFVKLTINQTVKYACTVCSRLYRGGEITEEDAILSRKVSGHIKSQRHKDAIDADQTLHEQIERMDHSIDQRNHDFLRVAEGQERLGSHPADTTFQALRQVQRNELYDELVADMFDDMDVENEGQHTFLDDITTLKSRLDRECNGIDLWNAEKDAALLGFSFSTNSQELPGDDIDDTVTSVINDMCLNNAIDEETVLGISAEKGSRYFPYPNKTLAILDMLDSFPRNRLSDSMMKAILWAMRQCGAENVPSFKSLRALQEELRKSTSIETIEFKSVLGNIFYVNDISKLIANDFLFSTCLSSPIPMILDMPHAP